MTSLRYRVYSTSSEHQSYPAGNLAEGQGSWQSSISPQYPIEITIQFYVPIRTKRLKILLHQYKIPKKIEVFVRMGHHEKYRKLGYILPDSNEQTKHESRELKTLLFQFSCTHIKLILSEAYHNDYNIFKQVAIDDLIVQGEILTPQEIQNLGVEDLDIDGESSAEEEEQREETQSKYLGEKTDERIKYSSTFRNNQLQLTSLPKLSEIYNRFQRQKKEAVEREDFQTASQLKKALNHFKELQSQIYRLEKEKSQALSNEDFDKCQKIKNQITRRKQVIEFQIEDFLNNESAGISKFYTNDSRIRINNENVNQLSFHNEQYESNTKTKRNQNEQIFDQNGSAGQRNYVLANNHDNEILPTIKNKLKQAEQNISSNKDLSQIINLNQESNSRKNIESAYEATSVKKQNLSFKLQNQFKNSALYQQKTKEVYQLKPLEVKDQIRLSIYFQFIPEKIWQMAFSKNWRAKLESIEYVGNVIAQIKSKDDYIAVIQLISRVITSNQASVIVQTLGTFHRLLDNKEVRFEMQHLPYFVEQIIQQLLSLLNDTHNKIKQLAYVSYLRMPEISFINIVMIINALIKHKIKVKSDPKLVVIKIQLMTALVEKYPEAEVIFKDILHWALLQAEDPHQKIKTQAFNLLITLSFQMGPDRVIKAIGDTKPEILQMFMTMLNSSIQQSKVFFEENQSSINRGQPVENLQNKSKVEMSSRKKISSNNESQNYLKSERSKSGNRLRESQNIELEYSQEESLFESSLQNLHHEKESIEGSQVYVLAVEEPQENVCEYCSQNITVSMKKHLLNQCKLLVFCQICKAIIYLREFTEHLLKECQGKFQFQMCQKCGLAFEKEEINQHRARDICKKKRGYNWERCQFCSSDVLEDDGSWIEHALKCKALPDHSKAEEIIEHQKYKTESDFDQE